MTSLWPLYWPMVDKLLSAVFVLISLPSNISQSGRGRCPWSSVSATTHLSCRPTNVARRRGYRLETSRRLSFHWLGVECRQAAASCWSVSSLSISPRSIYSPPAAAAAVAPARCHVSLRRQGWPAGCTDRWRSEPDGDAVDSQLWDEKQFGLVGCTVETSIGESGCGDRPTSKRQVTVSSCCQMSELLTLIKWRRQVQVDT